MYGGDEVNALVIDLGSSTVKAGYAGEDTPKALFPAAVGCIGEHDGSEVSNGGEKNGRKLHVGSQAMGFRKDDMEVVQACNNGLYDNWDAIEAIWGHIFNDRLAANPAEHPVMLAEPSFNTKDIREKTVELLFEKFSPPAVFLAKNAVLSSFAMGRQSSLVVDAGHEGIVVSAVHDGYVLQKSIARAPIGGRLLTQCMLQSVESKGITVRPSYSFKRSINASGQYELKNLDFPQTSPSYRQFNMEQIAADVKESIGRVSDGPFDAEQNASIPTVNYELPDGQEIQVGPDRFKVPEVLFNPDSINRCDAELRRDLYSGILLAGGTAMFTGLRDRLERELAEAAPHNCKVKVTSPANSLERKFSVWIGGSILASLGSFQQMWVSKKEYEEHGAGIVHRKAP
ncbi:putative Acttin-related protein 4 [Coccomyxa subellipsoidea C-169]|uniref:Acttin-related protein 4 n=1 Tax=Coccomyxa subellipsoidea (strain C-169) TaxID=574566 RepID=I0Z9X2_COCSC|nr:putative Acttin-related protein 4 [Coccomyxa subellipsoidea C-169]EIE27441.1 putative Acttin-related protein 4 [Coccomyxa subellipsoidea C-169]|eukprot:XP_005651985.1 putative Acttin-related protein 4 [Coccomyxa subellipsoidea C-169]